MSIARSLRLCSSRDRQAGRRAFLSAKDSHRRFPRPGRANLPAPPRQYCACPANGIPDVPYPARKYLDLRKAAEMRPDETKVDRERARHMTERSIHSALDDHANDAQALARASEPRRRLALRARQPVRKRPASQ